MLHVVLLEPEIPQNTGNISRTCAATGVCLHLIKPYGFELSERTIRRAGLDYWPLLTLREYDNLEDFFMKNPEANPYLCSTKAARTYSEVSYQDGDYLMFGKETRGLPESLIAERYARSVRIPMRPEARSLNLSNAVAIVVYEALRQLSFGALKTEGMLPK